MKTLFVALKDAIYGADDLLDEFGWHQLKTEVEVNLSQNLSLNFFNKIIQGSFNKKVDASQRRLDGLSSQLEKMGLRQVAPRFDKSIRPMISSFPTEKRIFGRDKELKELLALLCVPTDCSKGFVPETLDQEM